MIKNKINALVKSFKVIKKEKDVPLLKRETTISKRYYSFNKNKHIKIPLSEIVEKQREKMEQGDLHYDYYHNNKKIYWKSGGVFSGYYIYPIYEEDR